MPTLMPSRCAFGQKQSRELRNWLNTHCGSKDMILSAVDFFIKMVDNDHAPRHNPDPLCNLGPLSGSAIRTTNAMP
jgi:hypothetical protein